MTENRNRDAAAARIRALLAKTVENGATEAEAMSAAAKAAELLAKYGLTMTDVEVKAEVYGHHERRSRSEKDKAKSAHPITRFGMASAIGRLTGCKAYKSGANVVFFGTTTDAEVAHYLFDLVANAHDADKRRWQRTNRGGGRIAGNSWSAGFCTRVKETLTALAEAQEASATTASGTALVVVKGAALSEAWAEKGITLRTTRRSGRYYEGAAFSAGQAAGARVNITSGIGGGRSSLANASR